MCGLLYRAVVDGVTSGGDKVAFHHGLSARPRPRTRDLPALPTSRRSSPGGTADRCTSSCIVLTREATARPPSAGL